MGIERGVPVQKGTLRDQASGKGGDSRTGIGCCRLGIHERKSSRYAYGSGLLRSGSHAERRFQAQLAAEIAARDVFLLFWSRNARASKWVLWEFETARVKPGLNAILPMPLKDPTLAPLPPGFEDKHLRDRFMIAGYGLKKITEESGR